jgi:ADP-heptose:LPS heptosyltransferase
VDAGSGTIWQAIVQKMDALIPEKVSAACAAFAAAETYLRSRQLQAALAAYHAAEQLGYDPDKCAGARWLAYMLQGEFTNAWGESDAIDRRGQPDPHRFWKGELLVDRRIIIRCLHGLGDTLQYLRYVPRLRERNRAVILEVQPLLQPFLAQAQVADRVITWSDQPPDWDSQVEIVELPRIFRTTLETIPRRVPYLDAPAQSIDTSGDSRLRVGIVWAAGTYNRARSIPLATLSRIFDCPACRFLSIQAGEERAELAEYAAKLEDPYPQNARILTTASLLRSLDLLITVDTMVAHLGGALGIPVWLLLPFEADWRWMLNREDSPWYPTMRLFRQPAPGAWDPVVDRVRRELITKTVQAA